jgi:hypothetical protein
VSEEEGAFPFCLANQQLNFNLGNCKKIGEVISNPVGFKEMNDESD